MPATYAERTYNSPHRLVRYAHRRRYDLVRMATLETNPDVVLDYGCGEGEMLLSLLSDATSSPDLHAIAFEPWWTRNLNRRLEDYPDRSVTKRITVAVAESDVATGMCDVVCCAGVLEHITLAERFRFYEFAKRVLRQGGRVVIDVPVELGPAVLIKTVGRRVLKHYDSEYSRRELLRAAVGCTQFDSRRYDPRLGDDFFVSHKGFDHRLLAQEMETWGFTIEHVVNSPVPWLPATLVNQEVIIVAAL